MTITESGWVDTGSYMSSCAMGAAGDKLAAALLELIDDKQAFTDRFNALGLPGVRIKAEPSVKRDITGTYLLVTVDNEKDGPSNDHDHDDHRRGVSDIEILIDGLALSDRVKQDVKSVYTLIAEAESRVHDCPVEKIRFHEVGALDGIAYVVVVCLLMEMIAPEQVIISPVNVGSGSVYCAHGILPVPSPATAMILQGVPIYSGNVHEELCTPTGAALLKHFAARFGDQPIMRTSAVGYGFGRKDFEQVNCLRAFFGESEGRLERITKLECNVDDMTGEDIGFAMEQLFQEGAREVYTQAVGMKKNRPGILLSVICLPEDADRLAAEIIKHTSTLGVRRQDMSSYFLERNEGTLSTVYGDIRVKYASGLGVERTKLESEDVAAAARKCGVSIDEIRRQLKTS